MNLKVFLGQVLPYVTLLIFATGWIYRLLSWAALRPSRTITLYPLPRAGLSRAAGIFKRVLILPELYAADHVLWLVKIFFLAGLCISVALHAFVQFPLTHLLPRALGLDPFGPQVLPAVLVPAGYAYWMGVLSALLATISIVFFIARRLVIKEVRYLSSLTDFLALGFLLVIVALGTYLRLFKVVDPEQLKAYIAAIADLSPIPPPDHPVLMIHLVMAQVYLMYLPFSKAVHAMGTLVIQKIQHRR